MEMFLQDMVKTCALMALLSGMFLGWLITETKDGKTWKAPLWYDGKKWRVIQPPEMERDYSMAKDKNAIHPIRLTHKQVDFIKHLLCEFSEYFEEENTDLSSAITASEGKESCSTEGWGDGECSCTPKCT